MSDAGDTYRNRLDPPAPAPLDHWLGNDGAQITLIEYGSYHCPFCHAAHEVIANLRDRFGDGMRYVFRHRPITGDDIARHAAEFAEYAHETSGQYWEAHDALMKIGARLQHEDLDALTAELRLPPEDPARGGTWLRARNKVENDIES